MMEVVGEIRRRVERCQNLFSLSSGAPDFDWFENRQGEFNLWAATLKAGKNDRSSLDYRLRDNPEVRDSICDLLDGLIEELELLRIATNKVPEATLQSDCLSESENDEGSVFSGFSSNENYTDSLRDELQNAGLFSEHIFNIQTILGNLARISTVIRRSGAKYRYRKADSLLRKEDYEDFRKELGIAILLGHQEAVAKIDYASLIASIPDSSPLTPVQQRLVNGNIVRRNRIKFATKSLKKITPAAKPRKRSPSRIIEHPIFIADATRSPIREEVDTPVVPTQAPSFKSQSITQTATNIGSQLEWQQVVEHKKSTPSVFTRITKTGADQDYPSCPKPIYDDFLQCPYCVDLLPEAYYKNHSRWKGHVAQDILPYMCVYELCDTPDQMYLTSAELSKHMLGHHGVTRWVCDQCTSKSESEEPFVFESQKNWEAHVKKTHHSSLPTSQLSLLAKVSQRKMVTEQTCPLCGYATKYAQSTLDDHIAKHMHEFALRCLPWGTGNLDDDSVDAKSAGISSSSQDYGDDEDEKLEYLHVIPPEMIAEYIKLFDSRRWSFLPNKVVPDYVTKWLSVIYKRLIDFPPSQKYTTIVPAAGSLLLSDLAGVEKSSSATERGRLGGRVPRYDPKMTPIYSSRDAGFEALNMHLAKILNILDNEAPCIPGLSDDIVEYIKDTGQTSGIYLNEELDEVETVFRRLIGGGEMPDNTGLYVTTRPDKVQAITLTTRSYACPFRKHEPGYFSSQTSLPGRNLDFGDCVSGLHSIEQLKGHIILYHTMRPQCSRCHTSFATYKELRRHYDDRTLCKHIELLPGPFEVTPRDTFLQFEASKPASLSGYDEWYEIWRMLFPGEAFPDSPYIEADFPGYDDSLSYAPVPVYDNLQHRILGDEGLPRGRLMKKTPSIKRTFEPARPLLRSRFYTADADETSLGGVVNVDSATEPVANAVHIPPSPSSHGNDNDRRSLRRSNSVVDLHEAQLSLSTLDLDNLGFHLHEAQLSLPTLDLDNLGFHPHRRGRALDSDDLSTNKLEQ